MRGSPRIVGLAGALALGACGAGDETSDRGPGADDAARRDQGPPAQDAAPPLDASPRTDALAVPADAQGDGSPDASTPADATAPDAEPFPPPGAVVAVWSLCGNGRIDPPEACDDGDHDDHDSCTNACAEARCGDGVYRADAPECGPPSFAEGPQAGEVPVARTVAEGRIKVVEGTPGPYPTNDWWTQALVDAHSGELWAHPLVVRTEPDAVRLFQPLAWNEDGTAMRLESPLVLALDRPAAPAADERLLADFEDGAFDGRAEDGRLGWQALAGTAFGEGPAAGTLPGQSPVSGYRGNALLSSFHGGDPSQGRIRSTVFALDGDAVHLLMGGGNHPPEDPEGECTVSLWRVNDAGTPVERLGWRTGLNSEALAWQSIPIPENARGLDAVLELVDTHPRGWGHILLDEVLLGGADSAYAAPVSPRIAETQVARWGDWTVGLRWGTQVDVTLGHGLPFVWLEARDVTLRMPGLVNALEVRQFSRTWAFFDGPGVVRAADGPDTRITFPPEGSWVAVAAVPNGLTRADFEAAAPFVPRGSRLSWEHVPARGEVQTTWTLDLEALPGAVGEPTAMQGWLPHHLGMARGNFQTLDASYPTSRGPLRLARGTEFRLAFPFKGLAPFVPPPNAGAPDPRFNVERLTDYLTRQAAAGETPGDTYWGGKAMVVLARWLHAARQSAPEQAAPFVEQLSEVLADWLTFTPGETRRYFAQYPRWGALIGFDPAYGSEQFTDQHFHYGYFTTAGALLGLAQPEFLERFGRALRAVARSYGNADRDALDAPFLRTFDPWLGHSWAAGLGSPRGNNQESSSEAMQSWGGLFLLGEALEDSTLRATGAMGWAMERAATLTYWLGACAACPPVWPETYTHATVGILGAWGQAFATYFSADPGWIFGIQWLPVSPFLEYLGEEPAAGAARYGAMMADRADWLSTQGNAPNTYTQMGPDLANVVLGYLTLIDPAGVLDTFEPLLAENSAVALDTATGGLTWYEAHARAAVGPRRFDLWSDCPTSAAYGEAPVWVFWNGAATDRLCTVFDERGPVERRYVPAQQALVSPTVVPVGPPDAFTTQPALDDGPISALTPALTFLRVSPVEDLAVALRGPGVVGLECARGDLDGRVVHCRFDGALEPGATYTLFAFGTRTDFETGL